MAVRIEESFDVAAAPDRVWGLLVDPARVVQCLPGAELLAQEDATTFSGRIRVKVGPVTASYRGRARFEELDAAARTVRMSGEGQESSGGGSARMRMASTIVALPDGGARVSIASEVDVLGRLAQFGRGMMEEVAREMFSRFAECVRERLQAEGPAATSAETIAETSPVATTPEPATLPSDAASHEAEPLRILPILLRALRNVLSRLLGRRNAG
jgi:carbon monoxide dehydrogenase subunit G